MPDAEIEIAIRRHEGGYSADARFTSPAHNVLPAAWMWEMATSLIP